jgi:hypothetical protein
MTISKGITLAEASAAIIANPACAAEVLAVLRERAKGTNGAARRAAAWLREAEASKSVPDAKAIMNTHFAFMRKDATAKVAPTPAFTATKPEMTPAKPARLSLSRKEVARLDARIDSIDARLGRVESALAASKGL